MTFSAMRSIVLAAAVAAVPVLAQPAAAQSGGVSITIHKAPSYLNTRTVARPRTGTAYALDARFTPTYERQNSIQFGRSPLPSVFDVPGY